ncbi:MnmC family methyltransferase, partial [Acinetobacter baumannii]|uniref:MnmC family methyltransferase n=1 Tax=Acinetobacter baumannii TaxID=470 RepID=UPI000A516098
ALWQLWLQVRPNYHSHLHGISVEKFHLSKADLIRGLNVWDELKPLSKQHIEKYPLPLAGCHRLSFPEERFSIDLWLGDAQVIFPSM